MVEDNIRKFFKILVAIDGSEPSMEAADYAIVVAKQYDAALVALHVLPEEARYRDELERLSANTDVSSPPSPCYYTNKRNNRIIKMGSRRKLVQ